MIIPIKPLDLNVSATTIGNIKDKMLSAKIIKKKGTQNNITLLNLLDHEFSQMCKACILSVYIITNMKGKAF